MAKITKVAQEFIKRKIRQNVAEGKPKKQSVAIAFSQARERGFKVPARPDMSMVRTIRKRKSR